MAIPPPDLPAPETQDINISGPAFDVGFPSVTLCGFTLPALRLDILLGLKIPLPNLPPLPTFNISFALNCSLSNPIDVSAGVAWGGGRASNLPADPDDFV